jgi:glycosyltransferase involved in cell wall biosynthesis
MIREFVSVIISVGERRDHFGELLAEYDSAIRKCIADFEYVIVIDGHYPDVIDDLATLQNSDRAVRVVQFTRKFGDSIAISVGIEQSKGELVMTLPSFYQIEPASVPDLVAGLAGHDMVEGRRWPRRDSKLNQFGTWLYHKIIRVVTGFTFRDIGCSARLMRRQVAEEVMLYGEQYTYMPLLASNRGFSVREVSVPQSTRDPYLRYYGPGTYAKRLLSIFTIFFLIRFTKAPLRFFGVIGSVFLIAGMALVGAVVSEHVFGDLVAAGRPMLLFGVVFLVLGVQLFALGLIGELIIFTHGRELKEYSVAEIVSLRDPGSGEVKAD